MGRVKNKIACLLLAVYLPMWLMASFHVHTDSSCIVADERPTSKTHDDDCLLCQFQQQVYEDTPSESIVVVLPEKKVEVKPYIVDEPKAIESYFSSRAPPVLL